MFPRPEDESLQRAINQTIEQITGQLRREMEQLRNRINTLENRVKQLEANPTGHNYGQPL